MNTVVQHSLQRSLGGCWRQSVKRVRTSRSRKTVARDVIGENVAVVHIMDRADVECTPPDIYLRLTGYSIAPGDERMSRTINRQCWRLGCPDHVSDAAVAGVTRQSLDERQPIPVLDVHAGRVAGGVGQTIVSPYHEQPATVGGQLRAGGIYLNGNGQDYGSPFGGYKQSGNGREWGEFGLHDFLEIKVINGFYAA